MSHPPNAEQGSELDSLSRLLRLVKLTLGIVATALTIARMLGLL